MSTITMLSCVHLFCRKLCVLATYQHLGQIKDLEDFGYGPLNYLTIR
jgi:hypothetical protein